MKQQIQMRENIRSRYSPVSIRKQKKITRIIQIVLVILSILAIFLSTKQMMTISVLVPLSVYFLFLLFYPKMSLGNGRNCDENHISFPMLPCIICMIFLMAFINLIQMEEGIWLPMSAILAAVLLVPYLVMLFFRRIRERPLTILITAGALLILSFTLVPPINYIMSGSPSHDTVTVLSKEYHRNSRITHYEVVVFWRGDMQKLEVSKDLYQSVEAGDFVRVCIRKSIFGVEVWRVHE